jgi:hypothetical protein
VGTERAGKIEGGLTLHWLKSTKADMPAGSTQPREETRRLAGPRRLEHLQAGRAAP